MRDVGTRISRIHDTDEGHCRVRRKDGLAVIVSDVTGRYEAMNITTMTSYGDRRFSSCKYEPVIKMQDETCLFEWMYGMRPSKLHTATAERKSIHYASHDGHSLVSRGVVSGKEILFRRNIIRRCSSTVADIMLHYACLHIPLSKLYESMLWGQQY